MQTPQAMSDQQPSSTSIDESVSHEAVFVTETDAIVSVSANIGDADHFEWPLQRHFALLMQDVRFGLPLWCIDQLAILAPAALYVLLSGWTNQASFEASTFLIMLGSVGTLIGIGAKLYPGVGMHPVHELRKVVIATAGAYAFVGTLYVLTDSLSFTSMLLLAACATLSLAISPVARTLGRSFLCRFAWWQQPAIVASGNSDSSSLLNAIRTQKSLGWRPVAVVGGSKDDEVAKLQKHEVSEYSKEHNAFWMIVSDEAFDVERVGSSAYQHFQVLPRVLFLNPEMGWPELTGDAVLVGEHRGFQYPNPLKFGISRIGKRLFDIASSFLLLVCLAPLIAVLALVIKFSSAGPVLFIQSRPGLRGKRFPVFKFRTMVSDADKVLRKYLAKNPDKMDEWLENQKLEDDPRITKIGKFLRRSSLDELPQLFNVLRGDMSMVGPRPMELEEIPKYGTTYAFYKSVRPGITGMWQVNGRNNTEYSARLDYVEYYTRNWSLWLDWYILLRTFRVVLKGDGAR